MILPLSSIYWSFTGEGSVSVPCPLVCSLPPCLPAPGKDTERAEVKVVRVDETIQMSKQLLDANETEALPKAIDGLTTELENET